MHRLLQGDVGSGKTVVAALAAAAAIDAGWQCALMAPTEILAEQHFRKLVAWLEPLGLTVAWLTGSRKGKARTAMLEQVASGEAALVVGTHAVIQRDVVFARLGLAVVDEQHRFGVAQRLALRAQARGAGAGAAPADDERDADPAHAGDELLRRPRRQHHRRAAARPHADRHQGLCRRPPRAGDRCASATRSRAAARSTGSARWSRKASTWTCRTPPPPTPSWAPRCPHRRRPAARPHGGGREGGRDGARHGRCAAGAGGHHRDRGRCRRAQRQPDGDRACRALRPGPAAPVARPRRARRGGQRLRAALQRPAFAHRQGAAEGHGRNHRAGPAASAHALAQRVQPPTPGPPPASAWCITRFIACRPGRWWRSTRPFAMWANQSASPRSGVTWAHSSGSHSGRRAIRPMLLMSPLSPLRPQARRTSGTVWVLRPAGIDQARGRAGRLASPGRPVPCQPSARRWSGRPASPPAAPRRAGPSGRHRARCAATRCRGRRRARWCRATSWCPALPSRA
jgi:hypothetical protein